jgi:hypothetical protein
MIKVMIAHVRDYLSTTKAHEISNKEAP